MIARSGPSVGHDINCRNPNGLSPGTGGSLTHGRIASALSLRVACYLAVAFKVSGPVHALKMCQEVARPMGWRAFSGRVWVRLAKSWQPESRARPVFDARLLSNPLGFTRGRHL